MKVLRGTGNKEEVETEHSNQKELDDDGEEKVVKCRDDAGDDDKNGEILPGITKFLEGCKAFEMAFKINYKEKRFGECVGPVLLAHKKPVVEILAEDEVEKKIKGDKKKVKHVTSIAKQPIPGFQWRLLSYYSEFVLAFLKIHNNATIIIIIIIIRVLISK